MRRGVALHEFRMLDGLQIWRLQSELHAIVRHRIQRRVKIADPLPLLKRTIQLLLQFEAQFEIGCLIQDLDLVGLNE